MKVFAIRLSDELREALIKCAEKEGVKPTQLARKIIANYIKRKGCK